MDKVKILLGEKKHKLGVNVDNHIGLSLVDERRIMPPTDYTVMVDAYERYFAEKDASDKYRLSFIINPICSNVLFNVITEPVLWEGSDDCIVCLSGGTSNGFNTGDKFAGIRGYHNTYKHMGLTNASLNRETAIHDTGYSHPDIGPFVYHCGYDIFDNHFLRRGDGFFIVNSAKTADSKFNTLEDYLRNRSAVTIEDSTFIIDDEKKLNKDKFTKMHIYYYDGVNSYYNSITENLVERDGWFGFPNKVSMPVINYRTPNGKDVIINKCMNNDPAYGQIDMYPGRDLYSFVPKYNPYRRREEQNWDFCITYPYKYDEEDISYIKGGLLCENKFDAEPESEQSYVTFKTAIRNGFGSGEFVKLSVMDNNGTVYETANPVLIRSVGDDGRTFSVRIDGVFNEIFEKTSDKTYKKRRTQEIRVSRYSNGMKCEYHIRRFKRIEFDFDSGITKMAFSQNAYTDQIAQIVCNGDVRTGGLVDNLGRPVTELFLTIVKNNSGHTKWYSTNPDFRNSGVTYSHCFGKVSAGLDLSEENFCKEYNVHRIHGIPDYACTERGGITLSPKTFRENDIKIGDEDFLGDIVEYSPGDVSERVLEPIYYRFNTAQREYSVGEHECNDYDNFKITEIRGDDYDFNGFSAETRFFAERESDPCGNHAYTNLIPEGYYYQPHYMVKIHEFSDVVNQGYDRRIVFTRERRVSDNVYTFTPSTNYFIQTGDTIYSYVKANGSVRKGPVGTVTDTGETTFTVTFNGNYSAGTSIIYRANSEKPEGAIELNDGTGRYLWREVVKSAEISPDSDLYDSVFTNGAHYFHKNITFYLRRQDPDMRYGIGAEPNDVADVFIIDNRSKDVSAAEYVEEGVRSQC
jgi:hypothetical protein